MKHTINVIDLNNIIEHTYILASSVKELKRLFIHFTIENDKICSKFCVTQSNNAKEHKLLFNKFTDSLTEAIEWYNELY